MAVFLAYARVHLVHVVHECSPVPKRGRHTDVSAKPFLASWGCSNPRKETNRKPTALPQARTQAQPERARRPSPSPHDSLPKSHQTRDLSCKFEQRLNKLPAT